MKSLFCYHYLIKNSLYRDSLKQSKLVSLVRFFAIEYRILFYEINLRKFLEKIKKILKNLCTDKGYDCKDME
ncbi:hypothetical protein AMR47_04045 [Leptospira interrogans]|nr:hypothetical protein AMR47_04045 [Leptospira interrogans]